MSRRISLISVVILNVLWFAASQGAAIPDRVQMAAQSGQRVWVFLHDKGPDALRRISPMSAFVSARALARIQTRGQATDPLLDLPVSDPYRRALANAGLEIHLESRWFNAVSGTVNFRDLDSIAALPFVDSLRVVATSDMPLPDTTAPLVLLPRIERQAGDVYDYGPSRPQLAAIQVNLLHTAGLSGRGVRIGFLDTGFSLGITIFAHTAIVGTRDFINGDADVGDGQAGQMHHGTQTLSLCAGLDEGHLVGVAPNGEYAVAKTEIVDQEIRVEEDNWVAGLEWLDSLGCDLASSSLGYVKWYHYQDLDGNTALCTIAADLAATRGLLVVNAAGNGGCSGDSLIAPADGDSVLTVGAADADGNRASFSSCGPTFDGRIKPDVIAPGVGVITAYPNDRVYQPGSGTSFATPLVSGVCALLLEKNPSLTPYQLIDLLHRTATNARKPLSTFGWGMVQAEKAAGPVVASVDEIIARPNPANYTVNIVIPDSDAADPWTFRVFTVAGQSVYSKTNNTGSNLGEWFGVTDSGEKVAPGVYLILVRTSLHSKLLKVAWVGH
jgi:hypothetical protein